jgi:hypothetical protein
MRNLKMIFIAGILFILTGCISSRGLLIEIPQETATQHNGIQVYIRSIQDKRDFQSRPSSPRIPSFGSRKDIGNPQVQCRTIGRQRNGYGKALGNVFLSENQTVEAIVFQAVRSTLISLGYTVIDSNAVAKSDAIIVDISIDKFWAWINIGAGWTFRMDAEIETTMNFASINKNLTINGEGSNHYQVASSANWKKVLEITIKNYIKQAKDALKCLPDNC